jgi:uncharacterized membrane protein YedE/YeeE
MIHADYVEPILGGLFIGAGASLLLVMNGRIAGISGIASGIFSANRGDRAWRPLFIVGLLIGGLMLRIIHPTSFQDTTHRSLAAIIIAGALVGFGASMGSGCTSGHGVCGISRLSPRSLVATATFMGFGVLSVWLIRMLTGGL